MTELIENENEKWKHRLLSRAFNVHGDEGPLGPELKLSKQYSIRSDPFVHPRMDLYVFNYQHAGCDINNSNLLNNRLYKESFSETYYSQTV